MTDTAVTFAPVTASDLPLIQYWLNQDHWRQWWGEPTAELDAIADMVAGRDSTRPFLFHHEGRPAGYIHYWFVSELQTPEGLLDEPWLEGMPSDTVGIDLSIGDPASLNRGLGSATLRAFASKLVHDGYPRMMIDPSTNNSRAIRAYEKAGFEPVEELQRKFPDVRIMQLKSAFNGITR